MQQPGGAETPVRCFEALGLPTVAFPPLFKAVPRRRGILFPSISSSAEITFPKIAMGEAQAAGFLLALIWHEDMIRSC